MWHAHRLLRKSAELYKSNWLAGWLLNVILQSAYTVPSNSEGSESPTSSESGIGRPTIFKNSPQEEFSSKNSMKMVLVALRIDFSLKHSGEPCADSWECFRLNLRLALQVQIKTRLYNLDMSHTQPKKISSCENLLFPELLYLDICFVISFKEVRFLHSWLSNPQNKPDAFEIKACFSQAKLGNLQDC